MPISDYAPDVARADLVTENLGHFIPAMGQLDAKDEWKNPKVAETTFINIQAYQDFICTDVLYLVGRTGTGKTAILKKTEYEVNSGRITSYSKAFSADLKNLIAKLSLSLRTRTTNDNTYSEIEQLAFAEWDKIIKTIAMFSLFSNLSLDERRNHSKVSSYLNLCGLNNEHLSMEAILSAIGRAFHGAQNGIAGAVGTAAAAGMEILDNCEHAYREAKTLFPKGAPVLLLLDSMERYEYQDRITLAVLNALVNITQENFSEDSRIQVKLALPSELMPFLLSCNPEKIESKLVYIQWTHSTLLAMIAVRFYKYKMNVTDVINQQDAIAYFKDYYDKLCQTKNNFKFPTFAYCLIHTQRKPRQLMQIFDDWLQFESFDGNANKMDLILKALDQHAETRTKSALNIYTSVHENIFQLFETTFMNKKFSFTNGEFDSWLSETAGQRGDVSAQDIKRCFISSGLVGKIVKTQVIEPNDSNLENSKVAILKEAIFEYQQKEQLTVNNEIEFCLHPICYGLLNIEYDRNLLVYPRPTKIDEMLKPYYSLTFR